MLVRNLLSRISQNCSVYVEKLTWLFHGNLWFKRWIHVSVICSFWLVLYALYSLISDWSIVIESLMDVYLCILISSWAVILVFIFLVIVLTSLLFPKGSVDPNISELPSDFKWNRVIVEYDAPKWLWPSEVWLIYSLWYDWTNLSCLIYKWISEGLVTREFNKKKWSYIVRRIWQPKYTTPSYERFFRRFLFAENNKEYFYENQIYQYTENIIDCQQALVDYCVEKWYLIQKNKLRKSSSPNNILLFIVFVLSRIVFFFIYLVSLSSPSAWPKYKINLWKLERTKKWDELYARILWYKYFLEHCDEEKMKEVLKEDPDYIDKTLPYIIALRLNWKFLDRSYMK